MDCMFSIYIDLHIVVIVLSVIMNLSYYFFVSNYMCSRYTLSLVGWVVCFL